MSHPNESLSLFLLEGGTFISMSGNNIVLKQTVKELSEPSQKLEYVFKHPINRLGRACLFKKKMLYVELFSLRKIYLTYFIYCLSHNTML